MILIAPVAPIATQSKAPSIITLASMMLTTMMLGTTSLVAVNAAGHARKTLTVKKEASIPADLAGSTQVPSCTTNVMPLSPTLPHLLLG